ncbi:MAG: alcohol dehydrogenase catalytic domain-containing protein, partial [Planctomycetia bacterium]|nr:alcohol dehydrogenase catalytic domain-containing protein [Planctomycetia bacterium]
MKTAYFTGPRQLELRDEPEPKLAGPGDVLVRINRLGVCRSDVHYYVEGRIGEDRVRYPATLGHECAGTIIEVGSAVTNPRAPAPVSSARPHRAARGHTCCRRRRWQAWAGSRLGTSLVC